MAELTIEEKASVTYTLRNLPQGGWADITLREWAHGGSFQCVSDFGEYSYVWGSIGERNLRQFLCGLDMDYFLKKTCPGNYRVFSVENTCAEIRKNVLRERWARVLDKEQARQCWEWIDDAERECSDINEFYVKVYERSDLVSVLYGGDVHSVPICTVYSAQCEMFWERVWPHITKYWEAQCPLK